jgi:hypothetical protein
MVSLEVHAQRISGIKFEGDVPWAIHTNRAAGGNKRFLGQEEKTQWVAFRLRWIVAIAFFITAARHGVY